jgi:hypothetical protein
MENSFGESNQPPKQEPEKKQKEAVLNLLQENINSVANGMMDVTQEIQYEDKRHDDEQKRLSDAMQKLTAEHEKRIRLLEWFKKL